MEHQKTVAGLAGKIDSTFQPSIIWRGTRHPTGTVSKYSSTFNVINLTFPQPMCKVTYRWWCGDVSQSNSLDCCVKLSDPSQDCTDTEHRITDNMCFRCRTLEEKSMEKITELQTLNRDLADLDIRHGQRIDIAIEKLRQRVQKVARECDELEHLRGKAQENSNRWPVNHDLMYAGTTLAWLKKNCQELIPEIVANSD